jgi:hypothetical protein
MKGEKRRNNSQYRKTRDVPFQLTKEKSEALLAIVQSYPVTLDRQK